jgi:hypothetical protein
LKLTPHLIQPFVKKEEQVWVPGKFAADAAAASKALRDSDSHNGDSYSNRGLKQASTIGRMGSGQSNGYVGERSNVGPLGGMGMNGLQNNKTPIGIGRNDGGRNDSNGSMIHGSHSNGGSGSGSGDEMDMNNMDSTDYTSTSRFRANQIILAGHQQLLARQRQQIPNMPSTLPFGTRGVSGVASNRNSTPSISPPLNHLQVNKKNIDYDLLSLF